MGSYAWLKESVSQLAENLENFKSSIESLEAFCTLFPFAEEFFMVELPHLIHT